MSPGRRRVASPAIALLGLLAVAPGVSGQQQPPPDSTRARILERLNRLARPVGYDSVLFLQDSTRLAQAQQGTRPATSGMDSIARALTAIPGYTLTEYEAESADFRAGSRVLVLTAAEGARASVSQEGNVIEADSTITFDEAAGRIRTTGMATFTPPDTDPVDAANMIYDLSQARGSAIDARTSLEQNGANWIVRGQMPFAARDSTFMSHAQFTSCDLDEPHYHFETDEIKIVGGNVMIARGVRLYFADVPVAWLPFMAQSLDRDRASGLLTPRFSVNDIVRNSTGYRRRVSNLGFYWAMSDYSDALVAMDWFSGQFFSATSSLRYRLNRQFLDGDLAIRQFWREDGSDELALDTRHAWQIDERTNLRMSARYAQSNDFVRDYSINPMEVTQSIDSEAGLNRRFDWGQVAFAANRRQFLSDDRTEWLLPSVNLSLSPITLFRANPSEAAFFNNMTWSGSSRYTRNSVDYEQPDTFALASANTARTTSGASSSLNLGGLTFSQSVDMSESETFGVPEAYLLLGDSADPSGLVSGAPARDVSEARLGWSLGLSYQQQLIGSTTLTPRVTMNGDLFRSDTDSLAQSFVSGPSRVSLSASLKTDLYRFFPGFGAFEAIRHKISPSFDYSWTPETSPTDLQRAVFGVTAISPRNTISVTVNQTFEAKRRADEDTEEEEEEEAPQRSGAAAGPLVGGRGSQPRRLRQPEIVTLLALRTSVVQYDFVRADTLGGFTSGFQTTQLSNQISSDYLRGLSLSMDHELWADVTENGRLVSRSFDLHLRQLNMGFSLGSSSSIFRWLGFGRSGDADEGPVEPDPTDPLSLAGPTDESTVVPISGRDPIQQAVPSGGAGGVGGWNANLTYSLVRPRAPLPGQTAPLRETTQMLSGNLRLQPTRNWSLSWRTSYDLEASSFNDHSLRLTRDLHRWQANFDFLQTVTGNWTFRFEVSLLDNRDLKFDYDQQNLDLGLPSNRR